MENKKNRPAVYAGTYGLYNRGSLFGNWFYFDEYQDLDEMKESITTFFKDVDADPEIMFQDYENFPRMFYSECSISEELFNYCKYVEQNPTYTESAYAFVNVFEEWDESKFNDKYLGYFEDYYDLAKYFIDCGCIEIPPEIENYFDYDAYGRDLSFDFSEYDGYYFWY